MTVFLTTTDVLEIHRQMIAATGGSPGLRDAGLLDSAVQRPRSGFGGALFYPDAPSQAAALLHSLALNHPFVDGNKRTAFAAMDVFLRLNGVWLQATEDEKYEFVIGVVTSQMMFDDITPWILRHSGTRIDDQPASIAP